MITEAEVFAALKKHNILPEMIEGVHIDPSGHVQFALKVNPSHGTQLEELRQSAEAEVRTLGGVTKVTAVLTAQKLPAPDPHGTAKNPRLDDLPVKCMIAVASGKGGVGKSTIAFNLAYAYAQQGYKTGLLDADIYGPSVPTLSGTPLQKPQQNNGKLVPPVAHGIKVMSMGFLNDQPDSALIWRGPMVQTALYQLFRDVEWGTRQELLDILVIDMPPGTGDAHLTLAQKIPVNGAVIVSTPQDLALVDARKAVNMFRKTNVPILGIIENMSTYLCENCGHEAHIFGHGGAQEEARKIGVPFLGAVPLSAGIRLKSDQGQPSSEAIFNDIVHALAVKKAA